jgi:hypothetical protein
LTDKAANPVNMMGASKRIMEMFLMRESETLPVSTARLANIAFSDGSLLHGFNQLHETPADLGTARSAPIFRHAAGTVRPVPDHLRRDRRAVRSRDGL